MDIFGLVLFLGTMSLSVMIEATNINRIQKARVKYSGQTEAEAKVPIDFQDPALLLFLVPIFNVVETIVESNKISDNIAVLRDQYEILQMQEQEKMEKPVYNKPILEKYVEPEIKLTAKQQKSLDKFKKELNIRQEKEKRRRELERLFIQKQELLYGKEEPSITFTR